MNPFFRTFAGAIVLLAAVSTGRGEEKPDLRQRIRQFVADRAPRATADQAARWGLFIPRRLDERRPLVILLHGLNSERDALGSLGALLTDSGSQVGYFSYPDDQPIDQSVALLAREMAQLRKLLPATRLDLVGHSMGGLIARAYVEEDQYVGGVERLIMVGSPNQGSDWARFSLLLKTGEQIHEWKHDPQWRWTWIITSGLGEAGRDLEPHSLFLSRLEQLPRRAGVRYTIIAGCSHPADRYCSEMASHVSRAVPAFARDWWPVAQCRDAMNACAADHEKKIGDCDGPVTLTSASLPGVSDVVILPADHLTLIYGCDGHPPAALNAIRQRLSQ